jgi:putative Mn2+ efflux pump MntP
MDIKYFIHVIQNIGMIISKCSLNFFSRYDSNLEFYISLFILLVVGVVFSKKTTRGSKLLNRDQTDEWKGNRLVL